MADNDNISIGGAIITAVLAAAATALMVSLLWAPLPRGHAPDVQRIDERGGPQKFQLGAPSIEQHLRPDQRVDVLPDGRPRPRSANRGDKWSELLAEREAARSHEQRRPRANRRRIRAGEPRLQPAATVKPGAAAAAAPAQPATP